VSLAWSCPISDQQPLPWHAAAAGDPCTATTTAAPARSAIAIAKTASNLVISDLRSAAVAVARSNSRLDIDHGRNGYATSEGDRTARARKSLDMGGVLPGQ
jgi:hypothetical protein